MNKEKLTSGSCNCIQEDKQQIDIRSLSGRLVAKYDTVHKRIHISNHKENVIIQILPDLQITILN